MRNITIQNCNNIESGNITISNQKLNIKFGINGIGKSTISKAIGYSINSSEKLSELKPFKSLGDNSVIPKVLGVEGFKRVYTFDEEYLKQFVYTPDELVQNSFDIFIQTPSYKERMKNIESIVSKVKEIFKGNEGLNKAIEDLQKLSESFKATKSGISKSADLSKCLKDGNKLENIPGGLEMYKPFLKNEKRIKWIGWQIEGNEYLEISTVCPYCATSIIDKKDQIKGIEKVYDKNIIKKLESVIKLVNDLGEYFSPDAKTRLQSITTQKVGLDADGLKYLFVLKQEIDSLTAKLEKLRDLSFTTFGDVEKVISTLSPLKIDINDHVHLQSEKTKSVIDVLNNSLDNVLEQANVLQKEVDEQKTEIQRIIKENEYEINQFLINAGYKYEVLIQPDLGKYVLKLRHLESGEPIKGGAQHLSFGEKNALGLVLFMYDSLSKNPDLIVIDDPVSSFDKNKKYAILEMLFGREKSLKGKTVLMLTHDFEPIIDMVKGPGQKFNDSVVSHLILLSNHILSEKQISKDDIKTFSEICDEIVKSDIDSMVKLIYLRRKYEVMGDKGDTYQVISNLFHKRAKEGCLDKRVKDGKMTVAIFDAGVSNIKKLIKDFDYKIFLGRISSEGEMKKIYNSSRCGYEKLQIFRIVYDTTDNRVLDKFVGESYHIENEFICQLDPYNFDLIPQFIIDKCDRLLNL